jgi:hypothetical protein
MKMKKRQPMPRQLRAASTASLRMTMMMLIGDFEAHFKQKINSID